MPSEEVIGFVCVIVAVVCFGSNFVPVKKFETGDGLFFQWVMCSAIWCAGVIVNAVQGFPEFQPLTMLGGFLWCSGNVMVVPIVKTIGLSLGILIWGTVNLVMGWGSGAFGLFGLNKEPMSNPVLNYVGVLLAIGSIGIYVFVKTETQPQKVVDPDDVLQPMIHAPGESVNADEEEVTSWTDRLSPSAKRILGCTLSVVSGILYGVNFDPSQYLQDHGHSKNGLDYVFSHFTGIFATSTFYFLVYCIAKKNKPNVYPQAILPGVVSGTLWAMAQISWFVANANLNMVIAFPLISTGPGLVAALWGIFVFKEITGKRNYLIFGLAFTVAVTAVTLITLSKLI